MSVRRRTALRWTLVPVLAGLATAVVTAGAGAEVVNETRGITHANWYWRSQQLSPIDGSPVLRDPGEGDHGTTLVVSGPAVGGGAERFVVLKLDLGRLPPAEQLRRTLLVLPVEGSLAAPEQAQRDEVGVAVLPTVVVCLARGAWRDGAGARPTSEAPVVDCALHEAVLPGPDGAYRVDVAPFAAELLDGDASGLVLLPDVTQPASYELRFARAAVELDVLYETERDAPPTTTSTTAPRPSFAPPLTAGAAAQAPNVPRVAAPPTTTPVAPASVSRPRLPLDIAPRSVTRAPLAVFFLFACIGAVGLLFFSPSQT